MILKHALHLLQSQKMLISSLVPHLDKVLQCHRTDRIRIRLPHLLQSAEACCGVLVDEKLRIDTPSTTTVLIEQLAE